MSTKKIGVLFSGGLDSTALVAHYVDLGFEVWPLFVQCDLRWEKTERYWAKKFLSAVTGKRVKPLKIVKLQLENAYRSNWSQTGKTPGAHSQDAAVFLPARNLLLITKSLLALSNSRIFWVAIGTLRGNPFPDGKPEYFHALEKILSQSFMQAVKIELPFRNLSKKKVIRKYGRDYPLHLSLSCINPQEKRHCGKCNKCAERRTAFREAHIVDKTKYVN